MISIAICEDNISVQAQMEEYVESVVKDCKIEVFSSGEELLKFLSENNCRFSIYLMDIELPGISGIETAASIRKSDPYSLIIYVTDYKEYVYEVFETLPFQFITKPVEKERFHQVLSLSLNYLMSRNQMLSFCIERTEYQIPFREILYLESHLRQVLLYTNTERFQFYGKLKEIEECLEPIFFVRTHTSYIVNMEYIRSISDTTVVMRTGSIVPVSKKYRKTLKEKHLEYMKWRSQR